MSPASRKGKRIQEPLEKKGGGGGRAKPADFTVAARSPATEEAPFASAAFAVSVHDPRELPRPGAPEVAFAGRSNAGKSSAINALAGRRRLAFVSKTPGRTQLVNFFSLESGRAFLVDLPGYGYAGVPAAVRAHWKHLVGGYVANRPSLALVVLVMDVRHPLTELDRMLLESLRAASRPVHVLLTKADKLSKQAAQAALARVRRELATLAPRTTVQLFSSLKREGIGEAAARIGQCVSAAQKQSPG